jgi:integrase
MRGSVIKKGDRWYVKLELDPDPATGRRRQRWHSGFATKKEAERARVDLLSKLDRGEYVAPTQQTLGDFLTEWLSAVERTVRPSTFESYRRNMTLHVRDRVGATRLTRVDGAVLNSLYATLLTSGRKPPSRAGDGHPRQLLERAQALRAGGFTHQAIAVQLQKDFPETTPLSKDAVASLIRRAGVAAATQPSAHSAGLSPRTVAYVHTILHRALKDAVRWGRLARNPADAADPPRAASKPAGVEAWDASTLRRFLNSSRTGSDRLYGLWVLLASTGMRRGEALGVRWSDVDLEEARLQIVQTVIQIRGRVCFGDPKTAHGRRSVKLDTWTVAALREHRKLAVEERLLAGPDFCDNGLVFHQPDGKPLRPESVSRSFASRVRKYGLPQLRLHGLRHTWATLALQRGVHPRVVQERLGHSTIAITLGIYSHVAPTLHGQAAQVIADDIFAGPAT